MLVTWMPAGYGIIAYPGRQLELRETETQEEMKELEEAGKGRRERSKMAGKER